MPPTKFMPQISVATVSSSYHLRGPYKPVHDMHQDDENGKDVILGWMEEGKRGWEGLQSA